MFIKKLNHNSNIETINAECNKLINLYNWGNNNQICLTHRNGSNDIWFDGSGSLYNNTSDRSESKYTNWNIDTTWYVRQQIEMLESLENFIHGRIRIMRLLPKTGLSVHSDNEFRYHLVLKTNRKSYISVNTNNKIDDNAIVSGVFYHIPANGWWYKIDTRKIHWVYNGGNTERIHLVVCNSI